MMMFFTSYGNIRKLNDSFNKIKVQCSWITIKENWEKYSQSCSLEEKKFGYLFYCLFVNSKLNVSANGSSFIGFLFSQIKREIKELCVYCDDAFTAFSAASSKSSAVIKVIPLSYGFMALILALILTRFLKN